MKYIDLRDPRLERGRMRIAAGTASKAERDARKASILQLLETERGREIVQQLRNREYTIEQVHAAVQNLDLGSLEAVHREGSRKAFTVGLGETIDAWKLWLQGADRSPETMKTYAYVLNDIEKFFGVERDHGEIVTERAIAEITRSEGERWLTRPRERTGKPWAPRTQTLAHSLVAQLWDRAMAIDEEHAEKHGTEPTIRRNFWRRDGARKGVRGARIKRTRVEFLRRNEAGRLLWAIRGTPYAAWIATGIYAGLRGGEAANLRVGIDADLERGMLRIQGRGGEHKWRTKTDNSQRNIPLHPRLARWYRAHIEQGYSGEVYLFTLPKKDAPLARWSWRDWTQRAFKAGGIRYGRKKDALTTHSLRHTFASWLTMADVHPLKIARLMGDTVEMVMKVYAHLIDEDLHDAISRI